MIKIKRLKESLMKVFWKTGENPFSAFCVLIIVVLVLGGLVFYQYGFLAEKKEPQIIERPLQFKEALFQKILEEWQIRQKKFKEAELKEHRNLFQLQVPIPEELTE